MCQYCGCQAVATVAVLTAEHDAVVDLVGRIRDRLAADDVPGAARWCREMSAILHPHTTVEEEGLFPALAEDFPDHVDRLRREHQQIEETLDEARAAVPEDPSWSDRLRPVLAVLQDHVLAEQDGVFPAALGTLGPEQWERVEAVRSRVGSRIPGMIGEDSPGFGGTGDAPSGRRTPPISPLRQV